ncbi:MAG TPA: ABC transporter permease [Ilumatobacteraceae bacterium]
MTAVATSAPALAIEPAGSRLRYLLSDTMVYTRRHLAHIRHIPEKLLDVTIQPIMFVLLFTYVFGGAINVPGGRYKEYLIGGILIQSLSFGVVGPATSIATDLTEGVIDRFRSLPSSRIAYLLGHFLAELGGLVLSIIILSSAGLIVGWRTHTNVFHVGFAYLLLVVFAAAVIWLGTLVGLTVRAPDAVMGIAFVGVFPLSFLSNAFVPLSTLPTALQYVAAYNPISVLVAAVRELFGNPTAPITKHVWPLEHPVFSAWAWCLLLLLIAAPLALRRYKKVTTD